MCDCSDKKAETGFAREDKDKIFSPTPGFLGKSVTRENEVLMLTIDALQCEVKELRKKLDWFEMRRGEDLQRLSGRMDDILKSFENDSDNLFSRMSKIEREFYNHVHNAGSIAIKIT